MQTCIKIFFLLVKPLCEGHHLTIYIVEQRLNFALDFEVDHSHCCHVFATCSMGERWWMRFGRRLLRPSNERACHIKVIVVIDYNQVRVMNMKEDDTIFDSHGHRHDMIEGNEGNAEIYWLR